MMKPRNLGALVALGALTALPACSMFGGGNSGSGQYNTSSYAAPRSDAVPGSYDTTGNAAAENQSVAPVSRKMIRRVQQTLKQNGDYNDRVDGIWGPVTEAGVTKWQQSHNLNANGEIDVATLQSMNIQPGNQNGMANNNGNYQGNENTGQNGSYQANGNNGANGAYQPNADNGTNNGQNAQANGNQNYNTAGTHQTGSNYTNNNSGQTGNMAYPANQGTANNGVPASGNNGNATH